MVVGARGFLLEFGQVVYIKTERSNEGQFCWRRHLIDEEVQRKMVSHSQTFQDFQHLVPRPKPFFVIKPLCTFRKKNVHP